MLLSPFMRRLPDNRASEEAAMWTCLYSMFSTKQCPKALAWMAALCAATGRGSDAEQWLVELIGTMVFVQTTATGDASVPAPRDTAST
jgi:hypothetical protein